MEMLFASYPHLLLPAIVPSSTTSELAASLSRGNVDYTGCLRPTKGSKHGTTPQKCPGTHRLAAKTQARLPRPGVEAEALNVSFGLALTWGTFMHAAKLDSQCDKWRLRAVPQLWNLSPLAVNDTPQSCSR